MKDLVLQFNKGLGSENGENDELKPRLVKKLIKKDDDATSR